MIIMKQILVASLSATTLKKENKHKQVLLIGLEEG